MPGLVLRLLGGASLLDADGRPIGGRATHRHRLGLLAILATASPAAVTRDRLVGLLWPERDDAAARHLLRAALHELRQSLGAAALPSGTGDVRLEPRALVVDVHAFEAALAAGDLAGAVARYGGPFLDGFNLDEAQAFDEWATAERARLAAAHEDALSRLARAATASGDAAAAARCWRQLAAIRPTDGAHALAAADAIATAGDPAGALELIGTHARQLADEYGVAPAPDILALERRLRATAPAVPVAPPDTDPSVPAAGAPPVPAPPPSLPVPTPLPRRRRWRWTVAAVSGTALVIVAALAARPAARPATAAALAVLPFTVTGGAPAELASGLPVLLAANLDQVSELRVVSPRAAAARLADARRAGDEPPPERIARVLGASAVLTGVVSGHPQGLELRASLVGADGATLATVAVRGPHDSLSSLVDQVSLVVLRELWGRRWGVPAPRLAAVATTAPAALRAYLRGEAFLRAALWDSAASSLAQAVDADSTFALAHLRLAEPYGWRYGMSSEPAQRALAAAARFADRLAPRERMLLDVRLLHEAGDLAAVTRANALAARYPGDPEVQYVHADVRYHASIALGAQMEELAVASFDTAMAMDTASVRVLAHPITLALERGDAGRFDRAVARLRTLGGGSHLQVDGQFDYALIRAVRFSTPDVALRTLSQRLQRGLLPAWHVNEVLRAVEHAAVAATPPRADVLLAAHDTFRVAYAGSPELADALAQDRMAALVALGRLEAARPLLAANPVPSLLMQPVAYGYAPPGWTSASVQEMFARPEWTASAERRRTSAYWQALFAIAEGDAARARELLTAAGGRVAATTDSTIGGGHARGYRGALRAAAGWVSLVEGDTARALAEMEAGLGEVGYDGESFQLAAPTRIRWLRLLADRPDRARLAVDLLALGIDRQSSAARHELLARALANVGDVRGAARERARADALWQYADSAVRPRR